MGGAENSYRITSTLTNNNHQSLNDENRSEIRPLYKSKSVQNHGPSPSRIPVLKKASSLPPTSLQPLVKDFKHRRGAWPLAPFPPVFTPASPRTREKCDAFLLPTHNFRDLNSDRKGERPPMLQLEQNF